MVDIKGNIVQTGDRVVTFVVEVHGTRLRTGVVVKITPDESKRYDWAEVQIATKIGPETFHTYVQRNGASILKLSE